MKYLEISKGRINFYSINSAYLTHERSVDDFEGGDDKPIQNINDNTLSFASLPASFQVPYDVKFI